jgi:hypothetical protein
MRAQADKHFDLLKRDVSQHPSGSRRWVVTGPHELAAERARSPSSMKVWRFGFGLGLTGNMNKSSSEDNPSPDPKLAAGSPPVAQNSRHP